MEASDFRYALSNSQMLLRSNGAVKVEEIIRGKCGNDMTAVGGQPDRTGNCAIQHLQVGLRWVDLRCFSC